MRLVYVISTLWLAAASCAPSPQEIDALAERTLKEWGIPGLALSVVSQGQELKVAGYGVRYRGTSHKVDANTLFQISSLTKTFTALTTSMLVQEGKLAWEEPILTYLPTFSLKDACATGEITLRDLLCHHTGLPGTAKQSWRLWYYTERSTEDLIRQLAYLEPICPLRSHFNYTHMAYVVAGDLVAKASNMPWEIFCTEKILKPLGMKRTNLSYAMLTHDNNAAYPHLQPHIQEKPIPWLNWNSMLAAAGINSCANDMTRWLKYCLSNAPAFTPTLEPQSLMESEGFFDTFTQPLWPIYTYEQPLVNYTLGWMVYSVGDRLVFIHTGLSDGMQSILAIVPEEGLGISILANAAPQLGTICLLNELLDLFLGRQPVDWQQKARTALAGIDKTLQGRKIRLQESRLKDKLPPLRLSDYAGEYSHPAYGSILVRFENDSLKIELFNHEKGKMLPWQENQFEVIEVLSSPPSPWIVEFQLARDRKKVTSLKLPDLGVFDKH